MRLGILATGRNSAELARQFGQYPDFFRNFLANEATEFADYWIVEGEFPSSLDECDAYLITGSRHGVYEELPWIEPLKGFVREIAHQGKPRLVGICFGHQLIAEALGGQAVKSSKGWGVGVHTYAVQGRATWMAPSLDTFSLLVSHQDQVTVPPPQARVLAGSDFCSFGMLGIGDNILTLQSHPEMSKAFAAALFRSRSEQIGDETTSRAIESLEGETHESQIARWLGSFLAGEQAASSNG